MSATDVAPVAAAETPAFEAPTFGSIEDIQSSLGLDQYDDLPPDDRATATPAKADAKAEAKTEDKPNDKADDEVADLKAIEARAKERRKARIEARKTEEAKAAPVVAKPVETPAPKTLGPVEQAVKDTIEAINRLAQGDATAVAENDGAPAPDSAARNAALEAVTKKLDALQEGLKQTEAGKAKLVELEGQLRAIESERIVRAHSMKAIDSVADELPTLTDAKAIRAFNKEHGTDFTDAADMIGEAATRYFEKFKAKPDFADLARRIEQKLNPKQEETAEKPKKTSKTLSRSDASPPAARLGTEELSHEEALAEFERKYGG